MGTQGAGLGVGGREASQAEVPSCKAGLPPHPPAVYSPGQGLGEVESCVFISLVGITWGRQCGKYGGRAHLVPTENCEEAVSRQKLVLLRAGEQSFLDAGMYAGVLGWPGLLRDISIPARSFSFGRSP